jgi:iron uptake system component EfeO
MTSRRPLAILVVLGAASFVLAGCVAKSDVAAADSLKVTSTDTACTVSAATAKSGIVSFDVSNEGGQVSEFYLLAQDGLRIVGEAENIAPGASRRLTVTAQPGEYFTVCKPGMVGDGVGRAGFTVTGDDVAVEGPDAQQKQKAVDLYAAFVKDQVARLVPALATFTADYTSGDDAAARSQFPKVRAYYERIEPIAEALGDLDPRIDYREVDAKAADLEWTGFHRIEKDLWVPAKDALNADAETSAWQDWKPSTAAERATYADRLTADVKTLYGYVHSAEFEKVLDAQGIAGISNGAVGLLDEVATGKITGEEDWWSHTDLYDFAANVEGSKMAFWLVKDFASAQGKDGAALVGEITRGYAELEAALAAHGSAVQGFVDYTKLTESDKRELTDLINALAEPLSQLTATVLG